MSLRAITAFSINTVIVVAVMSPWGTVAAAPLELTQLATDEGGSSISLVSQEVAWWSPDGDSDELKLLFSEDRGVEELQNDSMAEILRKDPLQDEKSDDSPKRELDVARETDQENGGYEPVQKQSMTQDGRLTARLSSLRKPANSLTIGLATAAAEEREMMEPVNRAAAILSDQPPQLVDGSFDEIVRADRVPASFCHRPTYFQELNLERGGRLDCERCGYMQNAYSSFWFLTNAALLPYRIASQSPCERVSGYGDCRTCQRYDTPIEPLCDKMANAKNLRGTVLQAASMAGFAFLIW